MIKVRITQIKSGIKRTERQKQTLIALGIKKMHNPVDKEATGAVQGMIDKVKHLLKVENI